MSKSCAVIKQLPQYYMEVEMGFTVLKSEPLNVL